MANKWLTSGKQIVLDRKQQEEYNKRVVIVDFIENSFLFFIFNLLHLFEKNSLSDLGTSVREFFFLYHGILFISASKMGISMWVYVCSVKVINDV